MFYAEANHLKAVCNNTVIYCRVNAVRKHQYQVTIHDRLYLNTSDYQKAFCAIRRILKARCNELN